jgi:hypothetical protein
LTAVDWRIDFRSYDVSATTFSVLERFLLGASFGSIGFGVLGS